MTKILLCPLVGGYFHPPAKLVLTALPGGASLVLRPDPDNAFDPLAVEVFANGGDMVVAACSADEFAGMGFDLVEVGQQSEIWLGFLARTSNGKVLRDNPGTVGNEQVLQAMEASSGWTASLDWSAGGQALVRVEFQPEGKL